MITFDTFMILLGILLAGAAGGVYLGSRVEEARWRRNADAYVRIESRGALYKVLRGGFHDFLMGHIEALEQSVRQQEKAGYSSLFLGMIAKQAGGEFTVSREVVEDGVDSILNIEALEDGGIRMRLVDD